MITVRDFEILIPFKKEVGTDGQLKLFGGIATSTAVDRDYDRMDKSVMRKIASDLRVNSTVFFNHDTKGLGVGTVASVDEGSGDSVSITVKPTKAAGMQDVITQINEGVLKSFSIGGRIKDTSTEYDEKLGKHVRVVKDVEVFEVSVVGIPSNPDASIHSYITKAFEGDHVEKGNPPASGDAAVGSGPGHDLKGGASAAHVPSDGAGHAGVGSGPGQELCKCSAPVLKCMKCNKDYDKKPEPEGGPGEMQQKFLKDLEATPAFKEMTDRFTKDYEAKIDTLTKSYEEKLASSSARIEQLHKALDEKSENLAKSKLLAAEEDELHKAGSTEQTAKTAAPAKGSVLGPAF